MKRLDDDDDKTEENENGKPLLPPVFPHTLIHKYITKEPDS